MPNTATGIFIFVLSIVVKSDGEAAPYSGEGGIRAGSSVITLLLSAIIITGGVTYEVFNLAEDEEVEVETSRVEVLTREGRHLCSLPDLPSPRSRHSQSGRILIWTVLILALKIHDGISSQNQNTT